MENPMMIDDFYDTCQDEEMAASAIRSVFDPATPFTPVLPPSPNSPHPLGTTLSGRPLGSNDCAKASKLIEEVTKQTCEQNDNGTENMDPQNKQQQPDESTSSSQSQAPASFISASFFYDEARKSLNQSSNDMDAVMDTDEEKESNSCEMQK